MKVIGKNFSDKEEGKMPKGAKVAAGIAAGT